MKYWATFRAGELDKTRYSEASLAAAPRDWRVGGEGSAAVDALMLRSKKVASFRHLIGTMRAGVGRVVSLGRGDTFFLFHLHIFAPIDMFKRALPQGYGLTKERTALRRQFVRL